MDAITKDSISFKRIPKSEAAPQLREQRIAKWQNQSDHTTKGQATKQFFPVIKDRMTNKIKLTPNFTATVTAHGKTKAYLHRFKIIESPECACNSGSRTVEHSLYECTKVQTERERATRTQHFNSRHVTGEQK